MKTAHLRSSAGLILAGMTAATVAAAEPANLVITQAPRCGSGGAAERGEIVGRITGIDTPERYRVVIFAHTNVWWVQPLANDPFTRVDTAGGWSNWLHLGRRYAAILIKPDATFSPPAQTNTLPPVGGDVIAIAETEASTRCAE